MSDNQKLISSLIDFIRSNYSPQEKVTTSTNGDQTLFFRKSGKALCYIETKNGKHRVTVVIGASLNDKVQSANISKQAKEMFKEAKQFHDGKWLFFEVKSVSDVEDIKALLLIKNLLREINYVAPRNKLL